MTYYSVLSYKSALRSFKNHLDCLGISEPTLIDKNAIRDYIRVLREGRKLSTSTIENHFSCISAFMDYLVYEEVIDVNLALAVRKRYLRTYKGETHGDSHTRKQITTEQLKDLVESILIVRDKAVVLLLAKTGIRRGELATIDIDEIDLVGMRMKLKPKAKRSNRLLFFDEECCRVLQDWLTVRERYASKDCKALFVTSGGGRLNPNRIYELVVKHATLAGLYNPNSDRLEDHFTPHCLRHWFTTYLRRSGMPREHLEELRGDARIGAMDIYYHIDEEDLRKSYLAHIPKLGLK
jgi:integrase/recombinase XerD